MELFIPSLAVLFFGALICFFVLPRMSPYVLGIVSILMLGIGIWQHYSMFPYEYRTPSLVTDKIQQYAGFFMILAVIVAGIGVIMSSYGYSPPPVTEMLPEAITAPFNSGNSSKSLFNLGGNSSNSGITGAINNVSKTVTNFMKPNNSKLTNLVSPSFKVS